MDSLNESNNYLIYPIEYYHHAEVISVESTGRKERKEWAWREDFVGFEGALFIFKNTRREENTCYAHITDYNGGFLTTGYGEFLMIGNDMMLKTKNTIYKFRIYNDKIYFI